MRRNPDERLRELERQARSGDPLAADELYRRTKSLGLCHRCLGPGRLPGRPWASHGSKHEKAWDAVLWCEPCLNEWHTSPHGADRWVSNPDERLRELERAAASGDPRAELAYVRALQRSGEPLSYRHLGILFNAEHGSDSVVTYPDGRERVVRNTGWLRRQLHRRRGSLTGRLLPLRFIVRTGISPDRECYLRVELSDGTKAGGEAYGVPQEGTVFLSYYHPACYREAVKSAGSSLRVRPIEIIQSYLPGLCRGCGKQDPYLHTHTFETMFASCEHLWDWLQTDLFVPETLDWDGRVGQIHRPMHESTYGYPAHYRGPDQERGPDAECARCRRLYWSGDPDAHPELAYCPTCYARMRQRGNPWIW